MSDQIIRNKAGHTLGRISDFGDILKIKDENSRTLGSYDPKLNKTKDLNGRTIGTGNFLTTLLYMKNVRPRS